MLASLLFFWSFLVGCPPYAPPDVKLQDHTIFQGPGGYYLVSIAKQPGRWERDFWYARSTDLCTWESLGRILPIESGGIWDEYAVWAPHVVAYRGTWYLYYAGVAEGVAQSLLLATSTNPADADSWQRTSVVVQPDHPGMVYPGLGRWSDMRDPWLVHVGDRWHLYYTGRDTSGGIIGYLSAPEPAGPWTDHGAILTEPSGAMLESPGVFTTNDQWYLFYYHSGNRREEVRRGPSPTGPWSAPRVLQGWANEFWQAMDGSWMASYVTDYAITVRQVRWVAGWPDLWSYHVRLPVVQR
jgi:hypothetical protein